jgi:hypothetical protein
MSQIVHDLAPGADIRFATADNGEGDFANQIRNLATAGAKVIVDDVTYYDEPMYQDGVVGKAVEDVTAQGVTYFSSAGNENTIVGGNNVGSYETQAYRPTTCPATVVAADPGVLDCHDFNPNPSVTDNTYGITINGDAEYVLGWNEPQFGITTDLDFCVLNHSTGAVIGCEETNNLATQNAFELLGFSGSLSVDLVVARYAGTGTPRFKFISWRSALTAVEYPTGSGGDVVGPTTFGHNASRSGATVAAIPYNNASTLETYSSRGPATYCYGPVVGTTPAAPLSPCQTATVDVSATDGVANSFFGGTYSGVHRFYGTSAAAPHAAAIAALLLQERPCLTPPQVLVAMETTAQPVGAFGADAMGAGRLNADAALGAAGTISCGAPTGDWPQFRNVPTHSGYNATETTLSPSNVDALGVAWTATTGAAIWSSPAVANGVVYVGSSDGKLYAYAVGCNSGGGTCSPLWTATTGSGVESSPAIANGVVYVGS